MTHTDLGAPTLGGLRSSPLALLYLATGILGLVGTWYFNLRFSATDADASYLESWFANSAASSAAVDLLIVAAVASVWMVVEARRLRLRFVWLFVLAIPTLALAFSFPLFLAYRHAHLNRTQPPGGHA
ncbi:MAG: DUF2834 domain-containing protein [Nocardioides sp.]